MGIKFTQPFWWSICPHIIQSLKTVIFVLIIPLPRNYSKIISSTNKTVQGYIHTHIYNSKTLKINFTFQQLIHSMNKYLLSTYYIMQALEIQQWTNCTKTETKVPALCGAHSLVETGGWDLNHKENKWVK